MDNYDADAAFARRLIQFDADDPATYSPWTVTTKAGSGRGQARRNWGREAGRNADFTSRIAD